MFLKNEGCDFLACAITVESLDRGNDLEDKLLRAFRLLSAQGKIDIIRFAQVAAGCSECGYSVDDV